jgi:hypothetical protein
LAGLALKRTRANVAVAMLVLFCGVGPLSASSGKPSPPCGTEPFPNYPALGAAPEIALWDAIGDGDDWSSASCIAWQGHASTLVIGLAGRFLSTPDDGALLARIGAISSLPGVLYWSVTDRKWTAMFTRASALEGPNATKPRADFSAAELRSGREFYFLAAAYRSPNEAVLRLRVSGTKSGRIIVETDNVTPLRWFFVPVAAPGDVQTWYFLERENGNTWRFYSLTRVLYAVPLLAHIVPNASYLNRALAMYRYIIGMRTDSDPPAARD